MDMNPYHSPLPPPRPPQSRQPSQSPSSPNNSPQPQPPIPTSAPDLPPLPEEQPKKSKKKIILVIVAVLLLLGGGVVFYLWYSNPERVVKNAVEKIIKSPSSIAELEYKGVTPDGEKVTVELQTKNDNPNLAGQLDARIKLELNDFDLEIDGAWMATKDGDIYIKINNLRQLYLNVVKSEYGKSYVNSTELKKAIVALVKKVDGEWIKLEWQELAQGATNGQVKERKCYQKAVTAFYEDKDQQQQITDMYGDNKFVIVKNDSVLDGFSDTVYDVRFDLAKINNFGKKVSKSDVLKALEKCNEADSSVADFVETDKSQLKEAQKEIDKVDIKLWISRWTHDLSDVNIRYDAEEGEQTLKIKTDFNAQPKIEAPSKSISLESLQKELEAITAQAAVQAAQNSEVQSE